MAATLKKQKLTRQMDRTKKTGWEREREGDVELQLDQLYSAWYKQCGYFTT